MSAQIEAEAAVRRSERQLTAVLDNLPHVLTLKGADRRLIMVNRAFESRYGTRADTVIGKTPEQLADRVETAQLASPDVRADDLAVLATGRLITRERRRIKPNGVGNFLFNIQNPEGTVKAVAESAMREIIGRSNIEPVLTGARQNI